MRSPITSPPFPAMRADAEVGTLQTVDSDGGVWRRKNGARGASAVALTAEVTGM
jgi:hypothetical protein